MQKLTERMARLDRAAESLGNVERALSEVVDPTKMN
jgi:hypothetical protein